MLKIVVIIVLLILVIGLWIQPALTKSVVKATGKATFKIVKGFVEDVSEGAINETNKTGDENEIFGNRDR